jgi:hypothetical protein
MNQIALPNQAPAGSQGTIVEQSRAVAEVAAAVRVARDFPRDETSAHGQIIDLCKRLPVAQRAFYEVPNRGSGLSIHIARELARIWGNVDYGVRELHRDDVGGVSEMQAWAWDQQTNVRSTRSFLVPHAKMVGKGQAKRRERLDDLSDIYLNNQNIGARAVRECIFSMLPDWVLVEAEHALDATLKGGGGKPIAQQRADAIAAFAERGVTQQQLEQRLQTKAEQWQPNHMAQLQRVYQTITQDGISVTEFFPEQTVSIPTGGAE